MSRRKEDQKKTKRDQAGSARTRKPKKGQGRRRREHPRTHPRTGAMYTATGEYRFLMSSRIKLLICFVLIVSLFVVLIGRVTYINVVNSETYTKTVLDQLNYSSTTIPYRRGDITDRNGTVLATSEKVYNLILDAYVLTNSMVEETGDCIEPTLEVLETYFGLESDTVRELVEGNPDSRYRVMLTDLTYEELQEYYAFLESEDEEDQELAQYVKGVWFEDDYIRTYPYDTLACDLIGFTVSGNVGTYGIEQEYDDVLNGTNGREYGYLNSDSSLERTTIAAENGYNVVSTIDINIQMIVEDVIWEFNEAIGSLNTEVIVMDPDTGEVLAMASYPIFNLNEPRDISNYYSEEEIAEFTDEELLIIYNQLWRNFAISDAYEPGSTSKLFTMAAALEESVVSLDDVFYCDGGEEFADGDDYTTVSCNSTHGTLDLAGAIKKSCNDALMQIVAKLGTSSFVTYQKIFNFGQLTGIDLPGEASAASLLYTEETMGTVELATNSFGQGYSATAIQVCAAFCSLVNGGYYYVPHVVKEITTEDGSVVETIDPQVTRVTVSEETSEWILEVLKETVEEGTATSVAIEGYSIGAKTGTAEKKPIDEGRRTVSLISCAPAEDPEVVIYVVIDEPQTSSQGDSKLASIMSRKIYEELLPYLQIFPESSEDEEETQSTDEDLDTAEGTDADSEDTTAEDSSEEDADTSEDTTDDTAQDSEDAQSDDTQEDSVWRHLTDEEIEEVNEEYLGDRNTVADDWDVRPGAQEIEELREAAEEEAEEDDTEADDTA